MLQYLAGLADYGSEEILVLTMKSSKVNDKFLAKWLIFMPFLLSIGIAGGAFDGIFRLFRQAKEDVFPQ